MGFLDSVGKFVGGAYDALQKNAEEVEAYKEKLESCSDSELFSRLRHGSFQQKTACSLLLQERGYPKEEILEVMKRGS